MINHPAHTVLIVEPNHSLVEPYCHLPRSYQTFRAASIEQALAKLIDHSPDLVFLSASFAPSKSLLFLEALKNGCLCSLIPLIMVVDLSHRISFLPGTSWGGKFAIIDSSVSQEELYSTLKRVLKA